jgi:hypothetical protein
MPCQFGTGGADWLRRQRADRDDHHEAIRQSEPAHQHPERGWLVRRRRVRLPVQPRQPAHGPDQANAHEPVKRLTTLFLLRVWLACAGSASALAAETNILPGAEFHRPSWERPGRLLFVHSEQRPPYLDVTTNMATLFELELRNGRLTPLCRAPIGDLVVSADGAAKCVLFEAGRVPAKRAFLGHRLAVFGSSDHTSLCRVLPDT